MSLDTGFQRIGFADMQRRLRQYPGPPLFQYPFASRQAASAVSGCASVSPSTDSS